MNGLLSSSASGRASPDALVAAACHYRTVNLLILVIGPAGSVPVLAIGLVTKDFKVSASIRFGVSGFASECVPADLIFSGGHIITMNSERRVVSALAVRDGRIEVSGTDQLIASYAGMMTKKLALIRARPGSPVGLG